MRDYPPIPKFPHVKVKCIGEDGDAFAILARVIRALRKACVSEADIWKYEWLTLGHFHLDYNEFLRVTYETVTVT